MAPEILNEQLYTRVVDWWALGVLIYEMICGQSPFRGEDEDEIFESILHDEVLYPITMSKEAVSICQALLTKDPKARLGQGIDDANEIKRHAFFKGVDWDRVLAKKVLPPYLPKLLSVNDVTNFDEEFTKEPPILTPVPSILDEMEQREFDGFSYMGPS
ncbi:Serine/threonine kinase [Coelomomyces lativittatus]|nr:Serine/threonine kinase [Coelomomyces lativittatus]